MTNLSEANDQTFKKLSVTDGTEKSYDLAYELIDPSPLSPTANILFLGGFQSSMQGQKGSQLAEWAQYQGWRYARMDYRGHGLSDWNFEDCTLENWIDDAERILMHCFDASQPIILIGSSMGSWIAYHLAMRNPEQVAALIPIATAPDFIRTKMLDALSAQERSNLNEHGELLMPFHDKPMPKAFFDEGDRLSLLNKDSIDIDCPVHLLHGLKDDIAPWQNAIAISDKIKSRDVTIELLKEGDHRLSKQYELQRLFLAIERLKKQVY